MQVAMNWHRLASLPALHGSDIAPQVRGDSLPRVKPVLVLRPDHGGIDRIFVAIVNTPAQASPGYRDSGTPSLARQIAAERRNTTGRLPLPCFAVLCCLLGRVCPPSVPG
jgi:hypothetical protein